MELPENILLLIEKYQNGTISRHELFELNLWYHDHDDSMASVLTGEKLTESGIEQRLQQKLSAYITEKEHIDRLPAPLILTKVRPIWKRPSAVAAVILMIGASVLYFLLAERHNNTGHSLVQIVQAKKIENSDLAPGGNKAVLTLADGSKLLLDSAGNGLIGTQGNMTIRKLTNGQLTYAGQDLATNTVNAGIQYNSISTPRGGQYSVTLSDGTRVWLDAASALRYPVAFTSGTREVVLEGEAYFEVAKNAAKPFIVHAGNSKVEVLGTHFNVNAYPDEKNIKTTLLQGKVKVLDAARPMVSKYLSPGEQSSIDAKGNIKITDQVDLEQAVAWKNGYFQFSSTDLRSILRQLSRWYDADIVYASQENPVFTGQLRKGLPVSKVFAMLSLTNEIHYKIEGKTIIVTTK